MRTLEATLVEATKEGRVCPQPQAWNRIYDLLPGRQQTGAGWNPPLPLILAAWWEASDEQKRQRFHLHIRWAFEHGAAEEIAKTILDLRESDWYVQQL